jgi:type III pantothenate kinase
MNLVIDIGNTRTKYSVCAKNEVVKTESVDAFTPALIATLKQEYKGLDRAILSSVKDYPEELKVALAEQFKLFIELNATTPLPVENCYETKETLGKDRIAAIVGAFELYPETNVLVIDAGTAITYDLLTAGGKYLGGNISPGLEMRFKALNQFTGKHGIVYEVDHAITSFKENYNNLKVIMTGGDAEFFDNKLKNSFFVHFNLTSIGLNRILQHNGETK